jgi:2,5-diketo-D-gluconate reductase A
MTVPSIALHDGTSIPQLGFGVFQVPPADTREVVAQALEVGYRHLDTAQMYGNEAGVGQAVKDSGLPREDLYVTTKLNNNNHEPDRARRSLEESLAHLGEIDLFLIHWPLPTRYDGDFVSTWEAMLAFQQEGLVRSVGVSNFQPDHLERIVSATGVAPVVNQVEVHPYLRNEDVRAANARHGVATEAWAPIAKGRVGDDEAIRGVAEELGRTPAQVTLRWHLQRGDIVFPKSTRRERMEENFDVLGFELTPAQVGVLDGLDRGEDGRTGPHPDAFDVIPD